MTAEGEADASARAHQPVMASQIADALISKPGDYVDATIGGGGHAEVILKKLNGQGRVIGLDRDPDAVAEATRRLSVFGQNAIILHCDYRDLSGALHRIGVKQISGALFDFGLSTLQLDNPERGFAYRFNGPLDLRFDRTTGITAAEWLARASTNDIVSILREYAEERHALRIARTIAGVQDRKPITTIDDLLTIIRRTVGGHGAAFGRTAARVLQALRIVVNDELSAIEPGLNAAIKHLVPSGRICALAYHSLEDRIVKNLFRHHADGKPVNRRVLRPSPDEVSRNPRAKAARLRIFERNDESEGSVA